MMHSGNVDEFKYASNVKDTDIKNACECIYVNRKNT